MTPAPWTGGPRLARNAFLLLLAALLLARVPYSASSMDLARDMFTAWRILRGEDFPMQGPVLAGALHLGPVWYYLLALLMLLAGKSWLGTLALLGVLSATQVPLAYLAGKAAFNRRAGVLWAAALVVPSWGSYVSLLPLHTQLTAACVLAFFVCALRFRSRSARRYLFGMAASYTLALHAHPASIGLVLLAAPLVSDACRRGECRLRDIGFACIVVIVPLLPFLIVDGLHGFNVLRAFGDYAGGHIGLRNLAHAPALLYASTIGGVAYWTATMFAWPSLWSAAATAAAACAVGVGSAGLAGGLVLRSTRPVALPALIAVLVMLCSTCALREITPYYMTSPLIVTLSGAIAIGLALLGDRRVGRSIQASVATLCVVAGLVVIAGTARFQTRGAWPFAWWPIMDVTHAGTPAQSLLLMPAYAVGASGRFLCSQAAPSVHGVYAGAELHGYAMDTRLACGRHDVQIGGSASGRQHWVGLSRAMFAALDLDPMLRIGPLGVMPARALAIGSDPALMAPDVPVYPVYTPPPISPREYRIAFTLRAGEHLALSNIAFLLASDAEAEVWLDGRIIAPVASDLVSRVYTCSACAPGVDAVGELHLRTGTPPNVIDAVIF